MTKKSQPTAKFLVLTILLIILSIAIQAVFFTRVVVDCNCGGCEMACTSSSLFRAIIEGKKIINPLFPFYQLLRH